MALDFPNDPTIGDEFTGGGFTWVWDGTAWSKTAVSSSSAQAFFGIGEFDPSLPPGAYKFESSEGVVSINGEVVKNNLAYSPTEINNVQIAAKNFSRKGAPQGGLVYGNVAYSARANGGTYATEDEIVAARSADIIFSTDGLNWQSRTRPTNVNLTRLIYFPNSVYSEKFLARSGSQIHTSSNGTSWDRLGQFLSWSPNALEYLQGQFIAILNSVNEPVRTSTDGIDWTPVSANGAARANSPRNLAYANDLYASAAGSTVYLSTDLVSWTTHTAPGEVNALISNGSLFVGLFGVTPFVRTSTDGITWTNRTIWTTTTQQRHGVFGNGLFVIGGDNATLSTSTNGITWSSTSSGFTLSSGISNIAFGNGLWVANVGTFGSNGYSTSTNGTTWTVRSLADASGGIVWWMKYGPATGWIAEYYSTSSPNSRQAYSTDAINWTTRPTGVALGVFAASPTRSIATISGGFAYSTSGSDWIATRPLWTDLLVLTNSAPSGLKYLWGPGDASTAVVLYASTDGVSWPLFNGNFSVFGGSAGQTRAIEDNAGTIVVVGDSNRIASGTSLSALSPRTSNISGNLISVRWCGDRFLVGSNSGLLTGSTNGITWTSQTSPTGTTPIYEIVRKNGITALILLGNTFYTSTNNTTWTARVSPIQSNNLEFFKDKYYVFNTGNYAFSESLNEWSYISYSTQFSEANALNVSKQKNSYLVSLTNRPGGSFLETPDATSWNSFGPVFSTTTNVQIHSTLYENNNYVVTATVSGDPYGRIAWSTNGVTWTSRAFNTSTSNTLGRAAYFNNRFIFPVQSTSGVAGVHSIPQTNLNSSGYIDLGTSGNNMHTAKQVGSLVFLFASINQIFWTSPDGVSFTQRNLSAFSSQFADVAYGNGRYVLIQNTGPQDSVPLRYNVAISTDGRTWKPVASGIFPGNKIVFSAGKFIAGSSFNEMYSSVDGEKWEPLEVSGSFNASTNTVGMESRGQDFMAAFSNDGLLLEPKPSVVTIESLGEPTII